MGPDGPSTNAEAEPKHLTLAPDAADLAERAAEKLALSARGYTRTLRVAQTIADLANAPHIRRQDIAEALAFRHRAPARPNYPPSSTEAPRSR